MAMQLLYPSDMSTVEAYGRICAFKRRYPDIGRAIEADFAKRFPDRSKLTFWIKALPAFEAECLEHCDDPDLGPDDPDLDEPDDPDEKALLASQRDESEGQLPRLKRRGS